MQGWRIGCDARPVLRAKYLLSAGKDQIHISRLYKAEIRGKAIYSNGLNLSH